MRRAQLFHKSAEMIVFCHKWLHEFDQENNYKIKIVRRACVFCDRVEYCSLERLSFALTSNPATLYLPSIYNCSIKIITLLPIGWILFHRSYRIKFYHFTFVSFVFPVFHNLYFPYFTICISHISHLRYISFESPKAGNGRSCGQIWIKWQKRSLFAALLKLWIKDPAVFREKCCRGAICHQRIHSAIYPGHTCTGHRRPKTLKIFRQQQKI